ncbi:phosphate ABC transporter substrate-binding protein PstS [Vibrio fluvialis]|jgi:phosphate transport system substrate-binding protein|uniref:phosphate ABC transporter substrate-binding protein PstS n=1 Tax=Vibrio TaxID=662 RepID=UPI000412469D|nr:MULTISPECIES: phosphate ABC transporter substrate-binding protein PstS [Vibrio]EKO3368254.1 phosphate ABC transporter substrate-binding protein PstS [Vibrio fluvialis]EKO3400390.1 phosphate ABC transporter substrate-binding protein PstS [Vibrio fluvialis]EKO3443528.1 phosphate ABC transporter substrate-binding protein PstS [Vibrio fluvialis]EKO3472012.1 phosphate ABC transporter substrate-binding protein PstS [Vibrio fluvialis]EKO3504579.1 phosphate ABC transporter substrate-binding protein
MKMMKSTLLVSLALCASGSAFAATTLNGAGATFPYPVYAKWAEAYQKETGVQINYQAIGSGGGIRQIEANTVDFGGTDAPLDVTELNKEDMIQFPMVMGGIVPVVNIPGVKAGELKLTGSVLADIYLGKIKNWNDAAIAKLNPNEKLPKLPIYVVHRSDGSGTTFNFTDYLSRVSSDWQSKIGVGKDINWPSAATDIGGKGNAGVANYVTRTKGSIGYVEYAYATQNHLAYTQLQNKAGKFVNPTAASFQAAAANADWEHAPGFKLILNDQPGAATWPMTSATFILMHKDQKDMAKAQEMLKYFTWSYQHPEMAQNLDYVAMPESVVKLVNKTWKQNLVSDGQAVIR